MLLENYLVVSHAMLGAIVANVSSFMSNFLPASCELNSFLFSRSVEMSAIISGGNCLSSPRSTGNIIFNSTISKYFY